MQCSAMGPVAEAAYLALQLVWSMQTSVSAGSGRVEREEPRHGISCGERDYFGEGSVGNTRSMAAFLVRSVARPVCLVYMEWRRSKHTVVISVPRRTLADGLIFLRR